MAETKSQKIERTYVIPLRYKYQHVAKYKRTPKAILEIRKFLMRHMKIYDNDESKIKLGKFLNEFVWSRGIKNPPHKIKVSVSKDEKGIVMVELFEAPKYFQQKKAREDKFDKAQEKVASKQKKEKPSKEAEAGEKAKESVEKQIESTLDEKEKKLSTIEAGKAMEKEMAKEKKHETKFAEQPVKAKSDHRKGLDKK